MQVSVIGAGGMGTAIVGRLLEAGHRVCAWNRSPDRVAPLVALGAEALDSLQEAWERSDACVISVADSAALLAVTIESGLATSERARGRLLIDTSTVSAQSSARVSAAAELSGVRFLRAPISGSPELVRAGTAMMVVSGRPEDFDYATPILERIAGTLRYAGDGESARIVKLALNCMIAGTAQLMSEAVLLAEGAGVDAARFLEFAAGSAIGSPLLKYKARALASRDFTPGFSVTLMQKDVELALSAGRDAGVPMPGTQMVRDRLEDAISRHLGDKDFTVLIEVLRGQSGVL